MINNLQKNKLLMGLVITAVLVCIYLNLNNTNEDFLEYNEDYFSKLEYHNIKNPLVDKTELIKYPKICDFLLQNFPYSFEHDFEVKKHIIKNSFNLPCNSCIIDCGAHIGDGSIPIAHTLFNNGRKDIIVYAIDPSKYKCEFIKYISKINNIKNIKILNHGLSDKNITYKPHKIYGENTGGTIWGHDGREKFTQDYDEISEFKTLDYLCETKIIKEQIGYIHLDVETHEPEALKGALITLNKYKPILSIECTSSKDSNLYKRIIKTLPKFYKLNQQIYNQFIFIAE